MHPEHIRHLITDGRCLQLGPVLAPARNLYLNYHIRVLCGISVANGLHSVPLIDVPDLECQMGFAVGGFSARS